MMHSTGSEPARWTLGLEIDLDVHLVSPPPLFGRCQFGDQNRTIRLGGASGGPNVFTSNLERRHLLLIAQTAEAGVGPYAAQGS